MDTLAADLRYALRMLWKNPGFTAIAVSALALGIGANTAIFTVVNAVLLQPLPYPQPERLVKVGRQFQVGVGYANSIPKFMTWRQNDVFDAMALYDGAALDVNVGSGDRPAPVSGIRVSADYFRVFGVAPWKGRTFTAAEDLPGGPPVAVISYGLWQSHYAGDAATVGRTVLLNGEPHTIVGILPAGFHPEPAADLWTALRVDPNSDNQGHYLQTAARLKAGATIEAARAQMNVLGERFRQANPKWMDKDEGVAVVPMREAMVGNQVRTALLVLLGAVAMVLLIACTNVANLLLARAVGRQREMAIRAAVGANRRRVIRQLLTESVLLAGFGAALGFGLGSRGVRVLLAFAPGNIPRLTDVSGTQAVLPVLDWRVAGFTIGVAVLTGIVFGLFPALKTSNPDLSSALKEAGSRSGIGLRHNRARSLLVVTEVALALVLLVGAALLIRTFVGLRNVNPGFDPRNVITMQTSMAGGAYSTTAKTDNLIRQVTRRIESLPGVEAVAAAVVLPGRDAIDLPFNIAGKPPVKGDYSGDEQWRSVAGHYFSVFKIPLLRGRVFSEIDNAGSMPVVIVNGAMAKRYWPGEDPLGQVIIIGKGLGPEFEDAPRQIVGVVGNVRETGVQYSDVGVMYIPQSQVPQKFNELTNTVIPLAWAVRTSREPLALRAGIEREVHAVDAQLPISRMYTMGEVLSVGVSRENFNMKLLSIFAGIALALAAIGIYGLMSYSVQQRTQEIGVRIALGAGKGQVLRLILAQGMKLAGAGLAVGLVMAYAATRLLSSLLFGVKASDPWTFSFVAGILAAVALVATYIPAKRATRLEPVEALRYG